MEKIALITGASKGIGKELANVFAKNGYSLILVARNLAELKQVQSDLKNKYQCNSKILSVDLSKPDGVDQIMNNFKEDISKLDVLVNNAGFGAAKRFSDMTPDELNGMIAVNISTVSLLTYRVLPHMLAKKSGKILNVASIAAFMPGPYMAVYCASKAYGLFFSQALYEEYKKDGITVSTLCPGFTQSEFHQRAGTDKTLMAKLMPMMSAESVALKGYKGLMRSKRVIVTGFMNKLSVFSMWLFPTFITTKLIGIMEKPKKNPS